jgi:hypothetical protein
MNGSFGDYDLSLEFADQAPPNRHQDIQIDLAQGSPPATGAHYQLGATQQPGGASSSIVYTQIQVDNGINNGFSGKGTPSDVPSDCDLMFTTVATLGTTRVPASSSLDAYDKTLYGFQAVLTCRQLYTTEASYLTFTATGSCTGSRMDFPTPPPASMVDGNGHTWSYLGVFPSTNVSCSPAGVGFRLPAEAEAKAFVPTLTGAPLGNTLARAALFSFWVSSSGGAETCTTDADPDCEPASPTREAALICIHP